MNGKSSRHEVANELLAKGQLSTVDVLGAINSSHKFLHVQSEEIQNTEFSWVYQIQLGFWGRLWALPSGGLRGQSSEAYWSSESWILNG